MELGQLVPAQFNQKLLLKKRTDSKTDMTCGRELHWVVVYKSVVCHRTSEQRSINRAKVTSYSINPRPQGVICTQKPAILLSSETPNEVTFVLVLNVVCPD